MTTSGIAGLLLVFIFAGLVLLLRFTIRRQPGRRLREIPAFVRLRRVVGLAVESGTRIHVSLGSARLTGAESASGLVGLAALDRIARAASISDRAPVATAGSPELAILARDTLQGAYRAMGEGDQFDPVNGRLTGLTPFSYAAGAVPVIQDEQVSVNVLLGNFGSEVAFISDASDKSNALTIGGSDSIPAQAVLFAAASEPLIGEEVFASGAYLGAGPSHEASLQVQDIFRWVVITLILGGAGLSLVGLLNPILTVLRGIFR